MNLSSSTSTLLEDIIKFSGNKIKKRDDVALILELTSSEENAQLLKDLVFTAKYLNGLGKIIHSGLPNLTNNNPQAIKSSVREDSIEKVRHEYKINLQKFSSQLKDILNNSSIPEISDFRNRYLAMTQESMVNLTTLIYDLCWVKKYMNVHKK